MVQGTLQETHRRAAARGATAWTPGLWTLGLLLLGVVATSGPYYYWVKAYHRFLPITEGRVYKSGEMSPEALRDTVRDYGIRTVIDLRHDDPKSDVERIAMAKIGVRYVNIPSRQVPSEEAVKSFLQVMDETLANPALQPVLIHCEDGTGRSPLFAAIYRIEYEGWSNEAARSRAYWETVFGNFGTDSRKGRFILNYVARPPHVNWNFPLERQAYAYVPKFIVQAACFPAACPVAGEVMRDLLLGA